MSEEWNGDGYIEWTEGDTAYLSVVFSWHLDRAWQRAVWYRALGYRVRAGGPAIDINTEALADVAEVGGEVDALPRHNPKATFTTRGCIRRCPFCAVPRIEGEFRELDNWPIRPTICDNNFLASSRTHFDDAIDKLNPLNNVDFNQGLDSRLLTDYHAERLAELNLRVARLAWDDTAYEAQFMSAYERLRKAGIPASIIRVYVLIGFNDTPEDALYRLQTVKNLGSWPNPMRYQPLDVRRRNGYVAPEWTERQLRDYMRYWSRLRWLEHIPFEEYRG
jgi:hypothetical protein